MCYSGIPESYLTKECTKKFSEKITEFVYVGELIKRKYPTTIIKALNRLYTEETNYKPITDIALLFCLFHAIFLAFATQNRYALLR